MAGTRKEFELLFRLTATLSQGYAGQFRQASAAIRSLTNSTRSVQQAQRNVSTYQRMTATLTEQRRHLEQLQATQRSLQREYEQTERPSESLRRRMQQNESQIARTTARIREQESGLAELQQELERAGIDTGNLTEESERLAEAYERVARYQNQLQDIGRLQQENRQAISQTRAQLAGTAAAATATAVAVYNATVKKAAEFENQMSAVGAVSGASADDLKILTTAAKNAGATTKFTAVEAGKAMEYMSMAGWKTQQMVDGLPGVLNAAAASGEDLATVSDILTDSLTAMGYTAAESGQMADVLAAASSNSNTTISLMGETFKYVGTLAGTMGYSMEDAALATGLMANAGVKGSMAGTALAGVISRLSDDTNGARSAIEDLGVEFYNTDGSARPLKNVMDELRAATKNMTTQEKAELASTVAGQEAKKGLLAILDATAADYDKLADSIYNSKGAAERMANMRLDNYEGQITILKSSIEALQIAIGTALLPTFRAAVEAITPLIQQAAVFINNNPELIQSIAKLAAGLVGFRLTALAGKLAMLEINGGFLAVARGMTIIRREIALGAAGFGVLGKVLRPLSKLLAPLAATKGFQGIAKIAGLLGPLAPIALVLTSIVAGTQLLSNNLEGIQSFVEKIFGSAGVAVLNQIVGAITAVKAALHGLLYGEISGSLMQKIIQLVGIDGFRAFMQMRGAVQNIAQSFGQLFQTISTYVTPILQELLNFVASEVIPGIFAAISQYAPMIATIVSGLCSGIGAAVAGVSTTIKAILPVILAAFRAAFGAINVIVGGVLETISGIVTVLGKVKNGVKGVLDKIGNTKSGTAQIAAIQAKGYARGTNRTPDTFIAGENGPELITNAPGRKVYTAEETQEILSARSRQATGLPNQGNGAAPVWQIINSPQIDARGMSKEELEEVLRRNNADLMRRMEQKQKEEEQRIRRLAY